MDCALGRRERAREGGREGGREGERTERKEEEEELKIKKANVIVIDTGRFIRPPVHSFSIPPSTYICIIAGFFSMAAKGFPPPPPSPPPPPPSPPISPASCEKSGIPPPPAPAMLENMSWVIYYIHE